jgi:CheY-like chemotaxis protein
MRVLLIEPDEDCREIVRTLLAHHGHQVIEAADPAFGIELAIREEPDAILTELFIRTEDGWALLEFLRSNPGTARIPVVVVSAFTLPDDEARAVRCGARRFLAKPFCAADVLNAVVEIGSPPLGAAPAPPFVNLEDESERESLHG